MQVFTSRRGVPVFKSKPIKCHQCNHVFWAVRFLEHSPEDFFLNYHLREGSDLAYACSGSFCLWWTVLSLTRHHLDYDSTLIGRDPWKSVDKIRSSDMLTWPLLKAEVDSKANTLSFSFHLDRKIWIDIVALTFKLAYTNPSWKPLLLFSLWKIVWTIQSIFLISELLQKKS